MAFRLLAPQNVLEEMIAQALAEQPLECCGLLAGVIEQVKAGDKPTESVGRVLRRYPLINAAASPREFESEARSMFDACKDINAHGLEILAVYHSHPTSPPVPSETDRKRNYSPDAINLIIGLATNPPEVRGWWLTSETYREAVWEVVVDPPG